jgi:phosphoglycerate dehydrogenase-like enzyme
MDETVPVLLTLRFNDEQLEHLRSISPRLEIRQHSIQYDREDVSPFLAGDEQIVYAMVPPRDLRRAPHLRWVQLHSAGADWLHDHPIWNGDIKLTTANGIHAIPIGEFVIAMMLSLARKLPRIFRLQERAEWPKHKWQTLMGSELREKTLGIVGYGSIGSEVARVGRVGFGMRVAAMRYRTDTSRLRYVQPGIGDPEGKIPERWYDREELIPMLAASDYVVLALPLTAESRNLIGERELRAMKPGAFLINIARGGLVDEHALVHALKENWIAGAGLDVYSEEPLPRDSQLWHCENAILSPHISGSSPHYDERAVELFSQNLSRYLVGLPLLNLVDREKGY